MQAIAFADNELTMYVPSAFVETRLDVLHACIRKNSFATLITSAGGMTATHLPFLIDAGRGEKGTLRGHLARANDQWRVLDGHTEALVIFQGPHAYISPTWYQTQMRVPTWNYVAIHAYGPPKIIEDPKVFRELLCDTVDYYESGFSQPWKLDKLPENVVAKLQEQIIGFELEITRLEGKFKLNQNRTNADRQGVISGLTQSGNSLDREIAKLMRSDQS